MLFFLLIYYSIRAICIVSDLKARILFGSICSISCKFVNTCFPLYIFPMICKSKVITSVAEPEPQGATRSHVILIEQEPQHDLAPARAAPAPNYKFNICGLSKKA
jgi:hypothetical protein